MFDHTFKFQSTDGKVQLVVVAGTEGEKSLIIVVPPAAPVAVTEAQLMDYLQAGINAKGI